MERPEMQRRAKTDSSLRETSQFYFGSFWPPYLLANIPEPSKKTRRLFAPFVQQRVVDE